MTRRSSLSLLGVTALLAWGGLVLYTHFIAPQSVFAFFIFFIILIIALTSTLTPIAYFIGARIVSSQRYRATVRYAFRQALLLSLAIELNLLLRSLHSWNIAVGIALLGAAVIVEILSLARK
jgi:hypothetical protein